MIDLRKGALPSTVDVGGRAFFIYTDFRKWIDFDNMMKNNMPFTYDYLASFFSDEIPPPNMIDDIFSALCDFYFTKSYCPHDIPPSDDNVEVLDYTLDGEYIYGSFLHYYNIDLVDIKHLHWHKFVAMVHSLQDTKINEIMGMRAWKKPPKNQKDYDSDQRKKFKSYWSLPVRLSEEQRRAEERFNELF